MAVAATIAVDLIARTESFASAMKATTDKIADVGKQMQDIGTTMSKYVTAPIVGGFALATMAADKQAQAEAKLQAVIRATGGAAGVTAQEVIQLAQSLQRTTTFGDEATIAGAAVLLTFKSIRNELGEGNRIFERTIAVGQDLAALMGGDLQGAMVMLGKALEEPKVGLTALRRAGVSFDESQRELIGTLVDAGNTLEAQRVILEALESQVGGTAAEIARTAGGTMKQAFNDVGDAMERIGRVFDPIRIRLSQGVSDLAQRFQSLPDGVIIATVAIAGLAASIGPLLVVTGTLLSSYAKVVQALPVLAKNFSTLSSLVTTNVVPAFAKMNAVLLANPIAIVVASLAALAAAFVYVYQRSETFRALTENMVRPIIDLATAMRDGLGKVLVFIGDAFTSVFGSLVDTVSGFVGGVLNFLGNLLPAGVRESMSNFGNNLTSGVRSAVDTAKQIIGELRAPSLDLGVTGSNAAAQNALYGPIIEASTNAGGMLTGSAERVQQVTAEQVQAQIRLTEATYPATRSVEALTERVNATNRAQAISTDALIRGAQLNTLNQSEVLLLTEYQRQLRAELEAGTGTLAERNRITEELNKTTEALGRVQGDTTSKMGQFASAGLGQLSQFMGQFTPMGIAMELLGDVFKSLQPIVDSMKAPIKAVATALGAALLPVLKALWPIFRAIGIAGTYLAQVIFTVVGAIYRVVGGAISAIGNLIAKIPGLGGAGRGIASVGDAISNVGKGFQDAAKEMVNARDELRKISFDEDEAQETQALIAEGNKEQAKTAYNTARIADALESGDMGTTVQVNVTIQGGSDPDATGRAVAVRVAEEIDKILGETTLRESRLDGMMLAL
jgi:phage-related protein